MSKQDEASLILNLYDLRREEVMRKARDWYFREFHPDSMSDIETVMFGERGPYLRMVTTYWDMAASLVNHGAISLDMFNDTNGEHFAVYAKMQPFLSDLRTAYGPQLMANLEKLLDATPKSKERLAMVQERLKMMRSKMSAQQSS